MSSRIPCFFSSREWRTADRRDPGEPSAMRHRFPTYDSSVAACRHRDALLRSGLERIFVSWEYRRHEVLAKELRALTLERSPWQLMTRVQELIDSAFPLVERQLAAWVEAAESVAIVPAPSTQAISLILARAVEQKLRSVAPHCETLLMRPFAKSSGATPRTVRELARARDRVLFAHETISLAAAYCSSSRVLIVDDVVSSGATLSVSAALLRGAFGAQTQVAGLCLAGDSSRGDVVDGHLEDSAVEFVDA